MCKLIIAGILLISLNGYALSDEVTKKATHDAIEQIKSEKKFSKRKELLQTLKDQVFKRINSIDITPLESKTDMNSMELKEKFSSLNEFEGYLDLIDLEKKDKETCSNLKSKIEAASNKEGGVVPEAVQALKVLNAMCAD